MTAPATFDPPPDRRDGATGPLGVENVAMVHHDREQAVATFERLGFTLTPRGRYLLGGEGGLELGLDNHHALFPRGGYWEVITIGDDTKFDVGYGALLERRGSHLAKVTVRFDDATTEAARLRALGVDVQDAVRMRRSLEVADRTIDVDMDLLAYPAAWDAWLHSSLRHDDRGTNYVPELLTHPNGAQAIDGVVVSTPSMGETLDRLRAFTGGSPTSAAHGATFVLPDGSRCEVWDHAAAARTFPVAWDDGAECLRALIVAVEAVDQTASFLDAAGVNATITDPTTIDPGDSDSTSGDTSAARIHV
ncbi:MAG: VOC family protein, partial [Actinomycetota bacterium]